MEPFDSRRFLPWAFCLLSYLFLAVAPIPAQAAPEGRPCKSEPTDEVIQYGDLITCSLAPVGDSDAFRFHAILHEKVSIQVTRGSIVLEPCIQLFGPDGISISTACGGSAARLDVDIEQTGTHTIFVSDSGSNDTGGYVLSLERIFPVSRFGSAINYSETLTGQSLDPVGDRDLFLLNGTQNDRIRIQVTRGSIVLEPCIQLFGPDGVSISTACGGSAAQIEAVITQNGIHTVLVSDSGSNDSGSYTLTLQCIVGTCVNPGPTSLAAAVLPSSRSVQVGKAATAFATVINAAAASASARSPSITNSSVAALSCGITQITNVPTTFSYQATDSTNQPIGSPNTPVNIISGAGQSFIISLTPTSSFCPTDVQLGFTCNNGETQAIIGVNTLLVTASPTPVPDIIALAATINNDGIVNLTSPTNTGAFAIATTNVGVRGTIRVSADTGSASVPVTLSICETNPSTGICLGPPAPSVTRVINPNETPTFVVFAAGSSPVQFDPANNRVFVRFNEGVTCGTTSNTVTRGSTSVAVRTQ